MYAHNEFRTCVALSDLYILISKSSKIIYYQYKLLLLVISKQIESWALQIFVVATYKLYSY